MDVIQGISVRFDFTAHYLLLQLINSVSEHLKLFLSLSILQRHYPVPFNHFNAQEFVSYSQAHWCPLEAILSPVFFPKTFLLYLMAQMRCHVFIHKHKNQLSQQRLCNFLFHFSLLFGNRIPLALGVWKYSRLWMHLDFFTKLRVLLDFGGFLCLRSSEFFETVLTKFEKLCFVYCGILMTQIMSFLVAGVFCLFWGWGLSKRK